MNILFNVYMFLLVLSIIPIGCGLIYLSGIIMNIISDRYPKFEIINSVLAIIVILILFIVIGAASILFMLLLPIFLFVLFIMIIVSILYYIIRG